MTLGVDLTLDPLTHDLSIVGGDLVLGSDVAQDIAIRLKFFRGDWFLNLGIGIPYFEDVFVKDPRIAQLTSIYREAIATTPGVLQVLECALELNKQTRELAVTWKAESVEGVIEGTVEVD